MKRIICTVQEEQFSNKQIKKMEAGFKEIYKNNYRKEPLKIWWMVMPKGYAYSERKLSHATIILIEVDSDIEQGKREVLMHLFSQFLLESFHISPLDLVLSVANSAYVEQFGKSQIKRIHPAYRRRIRLKSSISAITSKFLNGYSKIRVRM